MKKKGQTTVDYAAKDGQNILREMAIRDVRVK